MNPTLALDTSYEEIRASFNQGTESLGMNPAWLLVLMGLVTAIISIVAYISLKRSGKQITPAFVVYLQLARELGLSWRQALTLYRIARQQDLTSPITLLLAPATFQAHARAYLQTRPPFQHAPLHRRLQAIQQHVFQADV